MSIDILAALDAAPKRGQRKCKVRKILEGIPEDAPGREKLVEIAECADPKNPDYRTSVAMAVVFSRLDHSVGEGLITTHRAHECICYR